MPEHQLSPNEIIQLKRAGIPGDRPGLGGEYPRMLYKKGKPDMNTGAHNLASDSLGGVAPLPIQGHANIITRVVADLDEELRAGEEGWEVSIDKALAVPPKKAA